MQKQTHQPTKTQQMRQLTDTQRRQRETIVTRIIERLENDPPQDGSTTQQ